MRIQKIISHHPIHGETYRFEVTTMEDTPGCVLATNYEFHPLDIYEDTDQQVLEHYDSSQALFQELSHRLGVLRGNGFINKVIEL